jgi:cytoskeletal protein CcmA (bactofilin family)
MKTITKILTLLVVALAFLAAPATVHAQDGGDDGKVVMGGSYRLNSGETLNGSLAVFGGEATIDESALVNGDVVLSGGTLSVSGEINGDIAVLGGTVFLSSTAEVHGDIRSLGGTVNKDPAARVDGTISSGPSDLNFNLPRRFPFSIFPNGMGDVLTPIWQFMVSILQALVMASIAVLVAMFAPAPTQRVAASIISQPLVTGAIGLLTLFVAPVLIVLLSITIILIPVSLIAVLALVIAVTFGWIALGLEIGQRMGASMFHTQWTAPVAAGIGTLVLSLISAVASIIPCIGWLVPFVIAVLGLGGVLASKFGTQVYFRPVSTSMSVPAAAAAPARPQQYQPPATSAQVYEAPSNELPDVDDPNDPQRPQNSL